MRRTHGYLLLEAAMAGVVVSIAIGMAMLLASQFRTSVTNASRRVEAVQLAEARLERYVAGDRTAAFGPDPVAGHPRFLVSGTAVAQPLLGGGVSGTMRRVTVTVQYPVAGLTKTLSIERWVR